MPIGNTPQSTHRVLPEVPRSPMARRSDPAPEVFVKVEPTHQPIISGASPPRRTAPGGMPAQAAAPPVLAHHAPGTALGRILWRASCWARSCRCRSRSSWWRRIPSCCTSSRLRSSRAAVPSRAVISGFGHAHRPWLLRLQDGSAILRRSVFGPTRWLTPMFRTAVRFRSAPFPRRRPQGAAIPGLQWFRRGIRRVTEACSVRANP